MTNFNGINQQWELNCSPGRYLLLLSMNKFLCHLFLCSCFLLSSMMREFSCIYLFILVMSRLQSLPSFSLFFKTSKWRKWTCCSWLFWVWGSCWQNVSPSTYSWVSVSSYSEVGNTSFSPWEHRSQVKENPPQVI